MGKTFAEKILSQKSGKDVKAGDIVIVEPDIAMSHDNTADISKKFYNIGIDHVYDPDKHVIILDHITPAANAKSAQNHKIIREFIKKQGIANFYDIEVGICHQVMHEKGHVYPGALIVGSDSHTTSYGAFGAFSCGIGRSEMAAIMARGMIWLKVPDTIKIILKGKMPEEVYAKDLILYIAGQIGADGALYQAIEFSGPIIQKMTPSSRFVLSNMAVELGAKIGYMIPNQTVIDYIDSRVNHDYQIVESDPDAEFVQIIEIDVSNLEPMIARPHTVDNVVPLSEVKGTKIDQVFFGSCTNARLEDFEVVVKIMEGKKVNDDVRMLIFPASKEIYNQALDKGWIKILSETGAVIMNPGCGPCMGNHEGILADGERALATSNRNFKGRLGNKNSEVYLGSPRTAAYTALNGEIS